MDKVIIGTALTLLTILAFFGLFIWLMFFNPTGSYSLSLLIMGLLVAFPLVFYLYMRKTIEYVFMMIVYSVLAFITLIIAMIAWNPNHIVSDNPGSFSYLMIMLASLGGVFGLTAKGTLEKKHGLIAAGSIILFYIASIFLKTNPYDIVSSNQGIIIAILSIATVLGILLTLKSFDIISFGDANTLDILKKSLYIMGIIAVGLALIYATFYAIQHVNTGSNFFLVFINILILLVLTAFVIKVFNLDKKLQQSPGTGDPSWFGLIKKVIFYLPCSIINIVQYIKEQYKITPKVAWQLLGIEILLIAGRFIIPYLYEKLMNRKGNQLVKNPQHINKEVFVANFEDLNYYKSKDADKDSDKEELQNYHYSISSWIYINSFPPNTNLAYTKDTSILNVGNKPNIQFNVERNELIIRMKETADKERIVLRKKGLLKYQKWNHIVVVYNGGTLDVFLNNKLIATKSGVIPYKQYDVVSYGSDDGIYGGICNVKYFNEKLSRSDINMLYNTMKDRDPPVI